MDEEQPHPSVPAVSDLGVSVMPASTISSEACSSRAISIFLVFFVNSLQQQITGNLTPYVTSAFAKHALIPVMGIVSSLVSGITKLPLAKLLDVWGRTQGFILVVFLTTISQQILP